MKKTIFTLLIILICLKAYSCPCHYCPIESKPDTARVITQKIWLKSVRTNGINGNRFITVGKSVPRVFFNSIALRFPKNTLQLAAFKLRLEHRVFDSSDFWGFATLKNEEKYIKQDEHVNNDLYDQSCLYFTGNDCYSFEIEQIGGWAPDSFEVEAKLIFVPSLRQKITKSLVLRAECTKPDWILQSTWRSGLPAPKPGRSATPTHHCIVHHSGDGNGNTNYTDLVRSYYVYHTQVNGWDDIAYNYLIAANGDIYAGRDPEKTTINQDNVLGAHFCGKNSFTMGVCLIGNFIGISPSTSAIQALTNLFSWKIHKDTLDPNGSSAHPNSSGALLPVIAGHRNGCSTECPGQMLYGLLPKLRADISPCQIFKPGSDWFAYSQDGNLFVKNTVPGNDFRIYDPTGRLMFERLNNEATTVKTNISSGQLLILTEWSKSKLTRSKLVYHTN